VELPVHSPYLRIFRGDVHEGGSDLIDATRTAAEVRRRLDRALPRQDAVLIVCRVVARVARGDVEGKGRDSTAVQLAGRTKGNDDVLDAVVGTGDRQGDCRRDRVHGGGVSVVHELEVVTAGDPVTGTDVEDALHVGRADSERRRARRSGRCQHPEQTEE